MINGIAIASNFFDKTEVLKKQQALKIAAVALACIAFFSFQTGLSWPIVGIIAFACSLTTFFSEIFLRNNDNSECGWFSISKNNLHSLIAQVSLRLLLIPIYIGIITAMGAVSPQVITSLILTKNLKLILLVTLIGPITEEIIFRGFVQERIEDVISLADKYISPFSKKLRTRSIESLGNIATSLLFGYTHIIGGQIVHESYKKIVFISTSIIGYMLGGMKLKHRSLISPIGCHVAHNTGNVIGILSFGK